MDPIISINNISKKYPLGEREPYYALRDVIMNLFSPRPKPKEFWAIKNVSFDIHKGEVVGVIGRNGAGKSTLLKILSRITPPTKGEAILRGRVASLLEVGTGFNPELTGRDNIYLNGAILGMTRSEIKSRFDEIVEFSEIGKFLDSPVKHYSSGMYMRLAFAVAAHLEPEILLVDEVLAVGDLQFQKKCLGKMDEVTRKEGRTILFVSHNMNSIQSLCKKCIYLEDGSVKMFDTTRKVTQRYLMDISADRKISIANRVDRQGNGKLKVTEVAFKNPAGKNLTTLTSGESFELSLTYQLKDKSIKSIHFGLDIDSFYEQSRLAFMSNKIFDQKLSTKNNIIKMKINKLALTPGRYQFTFLIYSNNGEILDWVQQAAIFDVEYGDFYGTGQLPEEGHGNFLLDYSISDI